MKISIITATYNSAKTIESAIQSVNNQTYPNIEHLIIDGASKDNTLELVKSYQQTHPNIVIHSEPDKGIYDALNKGLQRATGDIIGFLHSDDFFAHDNVLSDIASTFASQNPDGVYGDLKYVSAENTDRVVRYWKSNPFNLALLKKGWMPAHPTLFLKKEVYQKHGNFDLSFKIAADYDFILRVFNDETLIFHYQDSVFNHMRIGGASNSLQNITRKMREDYLALKKNKIGGLSILFQKNISKINQFF